MKSLTLIINAESAAVLLRCLGYGQSAISANEFKTGVEEVINLNVDLLRRQISQVLAEEIISNAAKRQG